MPPHHPPIPVPTRMCSPPIDATSAIRRCDRFDSRETLLKSRASAVNETSMKSPVERVLAKLGMPTLLDALTTQLSGADLASLLLETMRRRATHVQPSDLLQRYL